MDGLYDYIQWLGDYPFSAVPFQEVDAVIMCLLTYCDYTPLFEQSDTATLRDCQRMIDADAVRIQWIGEVEPFMQILKSAVASRRFGELQMSGYVDIMIPEESIQFSAITFKSDADWAFIAYRGTDSSLAGWKEDFMISFKRTQAQELARQYAENRIDPARAWYIGGHSKGGNLALYAACMLPEGMRAAVRRMYVLDGPGFCSEVVDPTAVDRVQAIATCIVPGFSIIGKLFDPHIHDTHVVQSSASALDQHDLATWGVDHGKLAELEANDPRSTFINKILDKWIGNLPLSDREAFVTDLFDALGAGGAKTVEELMAQGYKGYEAMSNRFRDSSDTSKRVLKDLSHQALEVVRETLI